MRYSAISIIKKAPRRTWPRLGGMGEVVVVLLFNTSGSVACRVRVPRPRGAPEVPRRRPGGAPNVPRRCPEVPRAGTSPARSPARSPPLFFLGGTCLGYSWLYLITDLGYNQDLILLIILVT